MIISWNPPDPRRGLKGYYDKFVGPGQTKAESVLTWTFVLGAGIAMVLISLTKEFGWDNLKIILAFLITCDMAGGVITNATSSAKRWYHREGQGFSQHFSFIALHAIQIFLVACVFSSMDWHFFIIVYGYLLLASLFVLIFPLYLQRPAALIALGTSFLISSYVVTSPRGLEWFVPVLMLKLLVSHLLKEAPFRPENEKCVSSI